MSGDVPADNDAASLHLALAELIGPAARFVGVLRDTSALTVIVPDLIWMSLQPNVRRRFKRLAAKALSVTETSIRMTTEAFGDFRYELQETLLLTSKSSMPDVYGVIVTPTRDRRIDVLVMRRGLGTLRAANALESAIADTLRVFTLNPGNVTTIEETQDRSFDFDLLRTVAVRQPVDLADVQTGILELTRRHVEPSAIQRTLDKLRKKGFVSSDSRRRYRMTPLGRRVLPSDRGRNAIDVQRALALGRRTWENG